MRTSKEFATQFFSEFYRGDHHIPVEIREYGSGWCVNQHGSLSSFDFDYLTRLVFLSHDRCARVEVINSRPGMLKIAVWKRGGRTGEISERHPTIDEALKAWRERHSESI